MLLLSLDSAGSGCGACVWRDGEVLACLQETMARGQDARLIPLVQETMAQAGVAFRDLTRLAVTRGPGSFTGLRIGLAAARGLGLAAGKTVVGLDRFAIHRAAQAGQENLLVVLESRRKELYTKQFCAGASQEASLLTPDEIAAKLAADPTLKIAGDAAETLVTFVEATRSLPLREPEVQTLAALAANVNPQEPSFLPRPLYLRPPDVTIKCEEAC